MLRPSPVARWYTGPNEIPLCRFIKAAVKADLRQLVKTGNPSDEVLLSAWLKIWQFFLDSMQDKSGEYKVKLMSELDKLEYDYRMIQLCVQRLSIGPADWAIEQLRRRVRVVVNFNPDDQEEYYRNLLIVLNQALAIKHKMKEKQGELDIIRQQEGTGAGLMEQHFDALITRVSLFAKFPISRQKTTLSEFIGYYQAMKAQEAAVKKQLDTANARR